MNSITKRVIIYIVGLFLLALGVTFSILAGIGVSPVSSLPYALSLILPISVGVGTILANVLFITIQTMLTKTFPWKDIIIQCLVAFIFGFFIDFTLWLLKGLPSADSILLIIIYMALSLIIIGIALLFYLTAKLPMMPYDTLTYTISMKWKIPFGKAKITSDMINVVISIILSLLCIHSLGSIGIGTFVAAYGIGKIVGLLMPRFQPAIQKWVFGKEA